VLSETSKQLGHWRKISRTITINPASQKTVILCTGS